MMIWQICTNTEYQKYQPVWYFLRLYRNVNGLLICVCYIFSSEGCEGWCLCVCSCWLAYDNNLFIIHSTCSSCICDLDYYHWQESWEMNHFSKWKMYYYRVIISFEWSSDIVNLQLCLIRLVVKLSSNSLKNESLSISGLLFDCILMSVFQSIMWSMDKCCVNIWDVSSKICCPSLLLCNHGWG